MPNLTTTQVSQILDCHSETVRKAVRRGRLKPIAKKTEKGGWLFKSKDIVTLPRSGAYYTAGKVYAELYSAGLAPKLVQKSANQFIRRMTLRGELPAVQSKISGYWLYEKKAIRRYVKNKNKL